MYYVVLDDCSNSLAPTCVLGVFKDDEAMANQVAKDHEQRYKDSRPDGWHWWSRRFLVLPVGELDTVYPLDYASKEPWGPNLEFG